MGSCWPGSSYEEIKEPRVKTVIKETPEEKKARQALEALAAELAKSKTAAARAVKRTQMHEHAMIGQKDKLKKELKGANPDQINQGDGRGFTAYHHACANGHPDCVKMLLVAGAATLLLNDSGHTGWDLAAQTRKADVVKQLKKYGAKGHHHLALEAEFQAAKAAEEELVHKNWRSRKKPEVAGIEEPPAMRVGA